MRQPIAASFGSSSNAATACAASSGVGEFRVVVQAEDDAAMTERRTAIAPAGDTVVAVQRQQCHILPPGDLGGEPREVLRPRTLINDEHVP